MVSYDNMIRQVTTYYKCKVVSILLLECKLNIFNKYKRIREQKLNLATAVFFVSFS